MVCTHRNTMTAPTLAKVVRVAVRLYSGVSSLHGIALSPAVFSCLQRMRSSRQDARRGSCYNVHVVHLVRSRTYSAHQGLAYGNELVKHVAATLGQLDAVPWASASMALFLVPVDARLVLRGHMHCTAVCPQVGR